MNIGKIPAKTARLAPRREALIDIPNERRMTFGELDQRVRRLANGLLEQQGLEKGDRVAILSKNCIEYMELYFACARVGLIAQPLNWRLGNDELGRIICDGEPRVLACSREYRPTVDALQDRIDVPSILTFGPDSDGSYEAVIDGAPDTEPAVSDQVGGDDPALILYTGGTTGESKGALHTHRTLFSGMINQTVAERVVPTDVHMLTGQMFHIPVGLAFNYMAHGCPVVLINFEARPGSDRAGKGFDLSRYHHHAQLDDGGGQLFGS